MPKELRGTRYLNTRNEALARDIVELLPYLDFWKTLELYKSVEDENDDSCRALLNANDRYYLLTQTLHRPDAYHPWLFERCREVEASPDGHLDLWARYHYKSSIGTLAGIIQEIICDPEITVGILSCTGAVAKPFLVQIKQELEGNEDLKRIHPDVFWQYPKKEAPKWSEEEGLVVKRKGNPKESTVEAHGIIDAMPTGKHFRLLNYDDLVTEQLVTNPDMIKKVTERWELSDNLGSSHGTRKWHWGTRYSFADTYGVLIDRKTLKERRFPATHDGTLKGRPVLLDDKRWAEVKDAQRATVNAQMLLNPLADTESTFRTETFKHYDVVPTVLNVYIMCDPSKGRSQRSDRTAIAVIGIDGAGNKYLLDGYCHRMKLSERWQLIKQLEKKWRQHPGVQLCRVGYEQYGMQSDLEVIEEKMQQEGVFFPIDELNSSRDGSGKNAKNDRIERLEPDMNRGQFYLPAVIYHPDFGGKHNNSALWDVWTEDDFKRMEEAGNHLNNPPVGTIVYRPMEGPTRLQRYCEATMQTHRIVTALRRRDERGDMYDLTRAFIEEARFHPFAPHDDLMDAVSRVYDMDAQKPQIFEVASVEPTAHPDS
jgi:hypothetical protein